MYSVLPVTVILPAFARLSRGPSCNDCSSHTQSPSPQASVTDKLVPDGKRPKLENQASTASSGSIGSQRDLIEPQHPTLQQRPDQASSRTILDTPQQARQRTIELTSPIVSQQFIPSGRVSPSTSVASLASSNPSSFPNNYISKPTARHTPDVVDASKNGPTVLPPIATLEARDPPSSQGSKFWFGYQPGSSTSNTSPLSDYRRSYHPPPAFVPTKSSSPSLSRSHSSEHSATTVSSNAPRAESQPYRLPPTPSRGSEASQMDGVESSGSSGPLESRAQPVYGPGMPAAFSLQLVAVLQVLILAPGRPALSPHSSSLSNLSLNVATPDEAHHASSSTRNPPKSHSYHISNEVLPSIRSASEHDVALRTDADPLAVLAYAGDIVDRKSRQAC
ncbi:MAG: hypothetical protein Q9207_000600 [Kuettlingeria erythrocarpa]